MAAHLEVLTNLWNLQVWFILHVLDGPHRLREYVWLRLQVLNPYGVVKGRSWRLEDVRSGRPALAEADILAEVEVADLDATIARCIRGSRAEQTVLLPAERAVDAASAGSESVGSFVGG